MYALGNVVCAQYNDLYTKNYFSDGIYGYTIFTVDHHLEVMCMAVGSAVEIYLL